MHILKIILLSGLLLSSIYAEMLTKQNKKKNFVLEAEQALNFEFKFTSPRDKCSVDFNVYDENDKALIKDRHNMKKANESFYLAVKKGTYYLELYTHGLCYNKAFDISTKKHQGNFEQEPNDNISTATKINESVSYTGYLQKRPFPTQKFDKDYFQIDVDKKAKLSFTFKHDLYDSKEYFYIKLFNYNNEKLIEYTSKLNKRSLEQEFEVEKGKYFLEVSTYIASQDVRNKKYEVSYMLK